MSIRPGVDLLFVKTTSTPPVRMKLPCCTDRTRSLVGSNMSVSETVDRPDRVHHRDRNGVRSAAHAHRGRRRDDDLRLADPGRRRRRLGRGCWRRRQWRAAAPAACVGGRDPAAVRLAAAAARPRCPGTGVEPGGAVTCTPPAPGTCPARRQRPARALPAAVQAGRRGRFRLRGGDERRRSADAEVLLRTDVDRATDRTRSAPACARCAA